jgi:hypothetical protein
MSFECEALRCGKAGHRLPTGRAAGLYPLAPWRQSKHGLCPVCQQGALLPCAVLCFFKPCCRRTSLDCTAPAKPPQQEQPASGFLAAKALG